MRHSPKDEDQGNGQVDNANHNTASLEHEIQKNCRLDPTQALAAANGAVQPAMTAEHIVQVVSDYDNLRMYFKPKLLTIAFGDTVTWVNQVNEFQNMLTFPDGYPKGAQAFVSDNLTKKNQK